jgi:hypothetical protein
LFEGRVGRSLRKRDIRERIGVLEAG